MIRRILTFINKLLPKYNHIIVQGFPDGESSAVEVANNLSSYYNYPVYFAISKSISNAQVSRVLNKEVKILKGKSIRFSVLYLTAKYLFFTHGSRLLSFSKRQTAVNIWHGILYKNVGILNNKSGIPADITVGTSTMTRKMFSRAFGVAESSVLISGYPRNDILLRSKTDKNSIKQKIGEKLDSFKKIIIWLPTYRKSVIGEIRVDGTEVNNPFYIEGFDVNRFNQLLKEYNTLCIVKPHPMAPRFDNISDLENLKFIDDEWILDKGITLYHLVGCTDMLISDVSSIIIDYMLMDQPIVCVSTDFEEYKKTRGFYFNDIENWIPTKVIKNQNEFIEYLDYLLLNEEDPYEDKREALKHEFFESPFNNSTKKLLDQIFNTI